MEPLLFWVNLLVGLFLSGFCLGSSFAFPPTHYTGHALFQRPRLEQSQSSQYAVQAPAEERNKVDTVRVMCHPDSLEIVIKADMFGVGAPVNAHELRLGVEHNHVCRATTSKEDEYRIVVGLTDCGTKHWMSDDSLVYTNLLLYSPEASPDWLIRMEEAVVPIECHYGRKYSLSSLSLAPNWIPFMSTQAAEQTFKLDLRTMTDNWLYTRSSNVFYVGEPISIEASVTVGHHIGLRVFVSSCVATLDPNKDSTPRYVFIENGCLVDSQFPGSKSHFLFRTRHDKLHFIIDAFKFHNEDKGELYITCQLNAVLVNDAEAPNKACTFVKGRWRSADSNDYLCQYCQSQSKASSPGKSEPHGVGKPPETLWGSGLKTNNVLEHDTTVGPMLVLPVKPKSWPLTVEELPLHKLRPALYGSQWRSGVNVDLEKGLLHATPDLVDEDIEINLIDAEEETAELLEEAAPNITLAPVAAEPDSNTSTAHSEVGPTPQAELAAEPDGTAHSEVGPTPQAELAAEPDGTAHSEVGPTPQAELAAERDGTAHSEVGPTPQAELAAEPDGTAHSEVGPTPQAELAAERDGTAHSEVGPTPQAELAAERDGTAHSEVGPTPQAELAAERDGTTGTAHSEVGPTPQAELAAERDGTTSTAHSEVGPTPQAELAAERDGTTSTAHSEVGPTPQAELAAERDGTTSTAHSEVSPTPRVGLAAEPDSNSTTTRGEASPTTQVELDVTSVSNASDLKETSDPER